MHETRRHSAWALLVLFAVGGLLAPGVHRWQHTRGPATSGTTPAATFAAGSATGEAPLRTASLPAPGDRQEHATQAPESLVLVCPPYHALFAGVPFRIHVPLQVGAFQEGRLALPVSYLSHESIDGPSIRGPPGA